jgi:prepilin-type N-terminal cleavage/methylation domain-containing protein
MNTPVQRPVRRFGFTLIEMMIVVALLGLIGSMLTTVLVRQQRFHRAVANVTDARARMRDIATILPTDMRGVSTAGSDILGMDINSMQFRAFVGTSIVCNFATAAGVTPAIIELPPQDLAPTAPLNSATTTSTVLSAWINPPEVGDIAFIYDDGAEAGNADDTWQPFTISAVSSAANSTWCASTLSPAFTTAADNGKVRYRISLSTAPNQVQVRKGAVIRFAREVQYSAYQASDNQWYVGYTRCTPNADPALAGTCPTTSREVLAGPVRPATTDTLTSGLFFVYWNQQGVRVTDAAQASTIARVNIGIRTTSESLRKATGPNMSIAGGDSLRFTIGIRNRI